MTYNKDFRPRLKGNKLAAFNNITQKERRILIVGDIHAPFSLNGYLDFCKETYAIYNCNQVIFIGDIIDNHYSSFHTTDPDGMGGGDELDLAIFSIQDSLSKNPGSGFPEDLRHCVEGDDVSSQSSENLPGPGWTQKSPSFIEKSAVLTLL